MSTDKIYTSYDRRGNRQHEFRQSYIHRNHSSVHPSVRSSIVTAVTRLNDGSPTRSRFRLDWEFLEPSTKFSIIVAHSPGYLLYSPQQYSWVPRAGVVSKIEFQIPEVSWRAATAAVMDERWRRSWLVTGCPSEERGVARTWRLSVSKYCCPSVCPFVRFLETQWEMERDTPLLLPSRTAESTVPDAEIGVIENGWD